MHAVNTNVLVRLLVRDDPRQLDAAENFVAKGAWVSHVVLVETLWVLDAVYERSAQQIAAAVERLLGHAQLALQDADVVQAALGQFRAKPTFSFSDRLVLELARKSDTCRLAHSTATWAQSPGPVDSPDRYPSPTTVPDRS